MAYLRFDEGDVEYVAEELNLDFDEAKDLVWSLKRGERGYDIVKQFNCPAFVYEPCFIDNSYHFKNLLAGDWIEAIAKAIWQSCIEIRDKISYNSSNNKKQK
jgi:hypothetical protein